MIDLFHYLWLDATNKSQEILLELALFLAIATNKSIKVAFY